MKSTFGWDSYDRKFRPADFACSLDTRILGCIVL